MTHRLYGVDTTPMLARISAVALPKGRRDQIWGPWHEVRRALVDADNDPESAIVESDCGVTLPWYDCVVLTLNDDSTAATLDEVFDITFDLGGDHIRCGDCFGRPFSFEPEPDS